MIAKNINFIGAQTQKKLSLIRQLTVLKKVMIGVFALCLLGYSGILVVKIIRQREATKLSEQITVAENQIASLRKTESLIRVVKSRVGLINTLKLADENPVSKTVRLVAKIMEQGFQLKDNLKFGDGTGFRIEKDYSTPVSLAEVNVLMDRLQEEHQIKEYKVESIQRQPLGGYRVTIKLQ